MSASTNSGARRQEPTVFSTPSAVENQVSRLFHAPIERVFRMFTDPAYLPYVFSPHPENVTIEKLDFRPGGLYSISVRQKDGASVRFHGEYLEIDPPRRVVNTFEVDRFPGSTAVETDEFEPVGNFTRLVVRWKFQSQAARDRMGGAQAEQAIITMWDHVADLLEASATSLAEAMA
jgi:uncharacterized protein YndB with AHSA1/START domain